MKKLAIIGLVAALAVPTATAAQTPKKGGTLIYGISAETPTYDCAATDTYAAIHFLAPFYSTLLKFDLANYPKVIGDLAENWTIAADKKTYTFKLRSGVTFHDGSPFSSADVKATYERLRDPPTGVVSTRRATFADIASIETPAPSTVVFKLSAVNPAMLEHFASPWNCIYSAAKLKDDPTFPSRAVLGTGAFKFAEHVKGSHVAGTRYDAYFIKDRPYLDGFKGVFILQPAALLNAIEGGQVMGEFRSISPAERDRLVQAMGDKIRIEESSWGNNILIAFNTEKKPFDDVRVRRALSLALDRWGGSQGLSRTSILHAVGGLLRPGSSMATPEVDLVKFPGFGKDIAANRAEAVKLLAEAGVPNLKFELVNRTLAQPYTPTGIYVVDQWRQIGVEVEHKQLETSPYLATLNAGNFEVAIDFSNLFMDEPSLALAKYVSFDKAPENRSRSIDRALDSLYEKQNRATSDAERIGFIRAYESQLLNQAYQVPILWWRRIVPTNKAVMGWQMSPSHNLGQDLVNVWLDQ